MRRERADREHLKAAGQHPCARMLGGERVLIYPNGKTSPMGPRSSAQGISEAEIAQLVSVALEDAIAALNEPAPEIYIRLRACEARAGIRDMLTAFPGGKPRNPKILMKYRRAIAFQNVALELALHMVAGIRRYSKVCECDVQASYR